MNTFTANVMLQFPAMPRPVRVEVTPQQLFFLDMYGERQLADDGTAIYALRTNRTEEFCTIH